MNQTKKSFLLLPNEKYHTYHNMIVGAYGLRAAIFLQYIYLQMACNRGIVIDGRRWVYFTMDDLFNALTPAMSLSTIKRLIRVLRDDGILMVQHFGERSGSGNRINYYSIDCDRVRKIGGICGVTGDSLIKCEPMIVHIEAKNTKTTNSDKNPISEPIKNKSIPTQLVDEWNEMSEVKVSLTRELAIFLMAAFKRGFGGCKERMVDYFRSLHEKKSATFRPQLRWALSYKTINRVLGARPPEPQPDKMVLFKPPTTDLGRYALMKLGMEKFISWIQDLNVVDGEFDFCGNNFLRERVERLLL